MPERAVTIRTIHRLPSTVAPIVLDNTDSTLLGNILQRQPDISRPPLRDSMVRGSIRQDSTVRGSTVRGSTVRGNTLQGSTPRGSTVLEDTQKPSTITREWQVRLDRHRDLLERRVADLRLLASEKNLCLTLCCRRIDRGFLDGEKKISLDFRNRI